MAVRIYISSLIDPFTNLAIENALLKEIQQPTLFLYQNKPSVIIGRAQNPWLETDVAFLQQNNIPLARRQSGGGTVVHDLGNLNFCFLSRKQDYHKDTNLKIVQTALHSLERQIEIGEKSDLLFRGKKISGSAFRETKDNCFHHGTLLLHSDLDFLRRCLQVPPRNIISKSVRSRPASVINLNLSIPLVQQALMHSFADFYHSTAHINTLPELDIATTAELYQSDDWIYGKTLPFNEEVIINGKLVTLMHDPAISARMTLNLD